MLSALSASRIWLCTQPTDMRCSFDGLSARVRRYLGEDPTSGHWFVFINRRRTMIKILGFDTGGYWIWSKRLEQGQFALGRGAQELKRELNRTALLAMDETSIKAGREAKGKMRTGWLWPVYGDADEVVFHYPPPAAAATDCALGERVHEIGVTQPEGKMLPLAEYRR